MRKRTMFSSPGPKISFVKYAVYKLQSDSTQFIHFVLTAALEVRNAGVIILMLREARDKCLGQGLKMFTPWLPILNDNPPGLLSFCTKLHTGLG